MRARHYRRGTAAERTAALWLQCFGHRLLARRYKTPVGEIDLIARRGRTLLFVEVKGRRRHAHAREAVHAHNQSRVVRAAQWWLAAHPSFADCTIRFDVVTVAWYRWPHHIKAAFTAA
jgi:putative endonuclease